MKKKDIKKKLKLGPQDQTSQDLRDIHIERWTSPNGKRRTLVMSEVLEKEGYYGRAEKKYCYYVAEKDGNQLTGSDLQTWMKKQDKIMRKKPHRVTVRREFNHATGVGNTCCRTTGSFYIVKHQKVFGVAFLHTVRFDILGKIPT